MYKHLLAFSLISSLAYGASRTFIGPTQVRTAAGSQTASALFELNSTTKGFLPPKLTTAQIASVAGSVAGLSVYNSTTNRWNVYDGSAWQELQVIPSGEDPKRNFILNSDHHAWQRGTTSTTITNGNTAYRSDRWYVKNSLGTNGVITYSRVTSSLPDGASAAASIQITTAPTVGQTNGTEVYYVLDNREAIQLYNASASFTVQVKALNNVNTVGVQFYYKTTEAKVDTSIGSEQTCAVTTGAWATCSISGQALGTSQTTSGVIGVRIRISAVSSGNTYDLNNGFIFTQASLTKTSVAQTWQRAYSSIALEQQALESTYEKSYDWATAPAATTGNGQKTYIYARAGSGQATQASEKFRTRKMRVPTVTLYNPTTGTSGQCNGGGGASTATSTSIGENAFTLSLTGPADQDLILCHYTADADL